MEATCYQCGKKEEGSERPFSAQRVVQHALEVLGEPALCDATHGEEHAEARRDAHPLAKKIDGADAALPLPFEQLASAVEVRRPVEQLAGPLRFGDDPSGVGLGQPTDGLAGRESQT